MDTFRVHDKSAPGLTSFRFVFNRGLPSQAVLDVNHMRPHSSVCDKQSKQGAKEKLLGAAKQTRDEERKDEMVKLILEGMQVPHTKGQPHICHIRQVGTVTFNPRKQVRNASVSSFHLSVSLRALA